MAKKYTTDEERKAAKRAQAAKWKAKPENRAKLEAYAKARRVDPEVKAKQQAYGVAYNRTDAGIRRSIRGCWATYGIKFESEFDREIWLALSMYDGTVCAVTGMTNAEHQAKFGKRLALDHDHLTGEPRRFLCDDINVSLGRLERLSLTDEQLNNLISLIKEDRR
jgi:hypothetical protein